MKRIIIIPFLLLFLPSCALLSSKDSLVGKWEGKNPEDGILEFKINGEINLFDKNGRSAFTEKEVKKVSYENVTEVTPHQIYLNFSVNEKTERIPFGIYKIENEKLIIRDPIEYHRTLGGFDMGVSRYEIPKDFNGIIRVFKRIK